MKFQEKNQWRRFSCAFFLLNLLLSAYFLDTWNTPNSVSRALPVLTQVEEGTLKINTYHQRTGDKSKVGEDYYSDKAPLPTFIMIPVYRLLKSIGFAEIKGETYLYSKHPVHIWWIKGVADGRPYQLDKLYAVLLTASFLLSSLPFSLMVWLTMCYTRENASSWNLALLVMPGWYGSYIFVYAGTFFSHVFAGFLLLLAYIHLKEKKMFWAAGFFSGLAFLSEYPTGLLAFIWPVLIYFNEKSMKKVFCFAAGVIPSFIAIGIYNYTITGNPFSMLNQYHAENIFSQNLSLNYGFGLSNISIESLWGLSFSLYMGIFVYIPVLLLVLFYVVSHFLKNLDRINELAKHYLAVPAAMYFLVFSCFFTWWGGWAYGPRYLIPIGCLLLFEGIRFLAGKNLHVWVYLLFTGFGMACAWLSKSTLIYMIPDRSSRSLGPAPATGLNPFTEVLIPEFITGRINGNSLLTSFLPPALSALMWLLLIAGSLIALHFLLMQTTTTR